MEEVLCSKFERLLSCYHENRVYCPISISYKRYFWKLARSSETQRRGTLRFDLRCLCLLNPTLCIKFLRPFCRGKRYLNKSKKKKSKEMTKTSPERHLIIKTFKWSRKLFLHCGCYILCSLNDGTPQREVLLFGSGSSCKFVHDILNEWSIKPGLSYPTLLIVAGVGLLKLGVDNFRRSVSLGLDTFNTPNRVPIGTSTSLSLAFLNLFRR